MRTLDHYLRGDTEPARLEAIIRRHCLELYGERLAAVFIIGSFAAGRQKPSSDLDVLIVIDASTESRPHRSRSFAEPEGYRGPEISPIIYTKQEFLRFPPFVLTLLEACRVVYSRKTNGGDEANKLFQAVREYAGAHGITRERHKGGFYWRGLPTGKR
jgi:predicted nucleotidyltransferase